MFGDEIRFTLDVEDPRRARPVAPVVLTEASKAFLRDATAFLQQKRYEPFSDAYVRLGDIVQQVRRGEKSFSRPVHLPSFVDDLAALAASEGR